jgi:hypothetical protein
MKYFIKNSTYLLNSKIKKLTCSLGFAMLVTCLAVAQCYAVEHSSSNNAASGKSPTHSASTFLFSQLNADVALLKDIQVTTGSFNNTKSEQNYFSVAPLGLNLPNNSFGYFTAIEYSIQQDLTLTGQWSRYQPNFAEFHSHSSFFKALDTRLLEEARTTSSRIVGLNWKMTTGWRAYAKVQTVAGSAWLPGVDIPRFVTQDSEDWTLAAIEVVYTF